MFHSNADGVGQSKAKSIAMAAWNAITGATAANRTAGAPLARQATQHAVVEDVGATDEDPKGSACQLASGDQLLSNVAAELMTRGDDHVARSLLRSTELAVRYGHSWWDGHDDYIYDVHVRITADPVVVGELRADEAKLRRAISAVVDFHRDFLGNWRRGTLETVVIEVGSIPLDPERLQRREWLVQQLSDPQA